MDVNRNLAERISQDHECWFANVFESDSNQESKKPT